jgi:hypothetical protein
MAAAAPEIPLVPIHPDLKYEEFFHAFSDYLYNGRVEGFYSYRAEVHYPMFAEIQATDNYLDRIVNVHRKYVTHFFRNNPEGAQHALQIYLHFALGLIYNRGLRENWEAYGSESVLPFVRSYVEQGASVLRLREFIQNFNNDFLEGNDPEILQQLKSAILSEIVNELRNKAFTRRKHAVLAWNQVYQKQLAAEAAAAAPAGNNNLPPLERVAPGNENQGGGRRRRSIRKRKTSKKTRRSHRVSHRK